MMAELTQLAMDDLVQAATLRRLAGAAVFLMLLVIGAGAAHRLGRRLLGGVGGRSGRIAAALLLGFGYTVVAFHALIAIGQFHLVAASILTAAVFAAAAAMERRPVHRAVEAWLGGLLRDLKSVAGDGLVRAVGLVGLFAILSCGLVLAVRLARSVLAPPMVWDELTYHLVKTGRWLSDGAWLDYPAPDCWQYYEYFPAFGSMFWAWLGLATGDLTLLWMGFVFGWLMIFVGTMAWARMMGAGRIESLAASLLLSLGPICQGAVAVAHVDILGAGCMAAGMGFATVAVRMLMARPAADGSRAAGPVFLGALGLALAMGSKQSFVPMALVAGAMVALTTLYRVAGRCIRRPHWVGIAAAGPVVLGCLPYIKAMIDTGNPLHPFPSVFGPGNDQLLGVLKGRYLSMPDDIKGFEAEVVRTWFWAWFIDWKPMLNPDKLLPGDFLNFGPGGLMLAAAALLGIIKAAQPGGAGTDRAGYLPGLVLAAATVGIVAWYFASDLAVMQRTVWQEYSGRFALPAWVGFAVLAARWPWGPAWKFLLCFGLLVNWPYVFPYGLALAEELPCLVLGALIGAGLLFTMWSFAGRWNGKGGIRRATVLIPVMGFAGLVALSSSARVAARQTYYEYLSRHRIYNYHALSPLYRTEGVFWRRLDQLGPATIHYSAEFYHQGLNWYRLPLMGPRFENRVVYVSPWADGELVDGDRVLEHTRAGGRFSPDIWLDRLANQGVDYVAFTGKHQPLRALVDMYPRRFVKLYEVGPAHSALYRFVRDSETTSAQNIVARLE